MVFAQPSISYVVYFPMWGFLVKKGKHMVDKVLTGMR